MSAFLLGDIIFIFAWIVLFLVSPKTRKLQLFGSLLLIPFGFLDICFRPDYCHPPLLIKAIEPLSIETLIYCFGAGGIAAVFGSLFIKKKFDLSKIILSRLAVFLIIGFGIYFVLEFMTKVNAMNCLNYSFLIIWGFLLIVNIKENWKSIGCALLFSIFTIIAINIGLLFYPDFVSEYWNLDANWPLFLNTPSEEIFFAGIMAALWVLLPKYLIQNKS